ncbi:MAG: glucosaminidase domain-containing protein [Anaerolineaceae bacterium]
MNKNIVKTIRIISVILMVFVLIPAPFSVQAYAGFIDDAVGPAQASQKDTGVPASVTIAQAILESGWGDSHIGTANNYFGIKCQKRSDGTLYYGTIANGCVSVNTKEWTGTEYITVKANFRTYASITDSFRDHGRFFIENSRYATAMKYTNDPKQFAIEIHKAGYATSPTYSTNLIGLMDKYDLYQYDSNTPTNSGTPNITYTTLISPWGSASVGSQVAITIGATDVASHHEISYIDIFCNQKSIGRISGNFGTFSWNAAGLSAGTYSFELSAGVKEWSGSVNNGKFTYALTSTSQTSKPSVPTLSSPSNRTTLSQKLSVSLGWNDAQGATQYKVELWGGPYTTMTPCDWQSNTTCQIGQMQSGLMYWHVKARNSEGAESDWSETWSFTIAANLPTNTPITPTVLPNSSRPSLAYPGNGSEMAQNTDVTLNWNSATNASQYKVELWGGQYSTITPCDWQGNISCHIGTMWPGTMYWHVKARSSTGKESEWSDTWSFTIRSLQLPTSTLVPPTSVPATSVPVLNRPSLSSPGNGSSSAKTTDVSLNWNNATNANQYKVELWGGPYSTMTPCDWQNGTSCHIGQMWAGTMYWHVKARSSSGQESDWSDTWSFTIQDAPQPTNVPAPTSTPVPPSSSGPSPSSPGNGSSLPRTTDINLVWNTYSTASQYKVELWGGPYSTMTPCNWQSSTSCHIGTMWPGTMYWHVKGRNSNNQESDWGPTWSFVIQN